MRGEMLLAGFVESLMTPARIAVGIASEAKRSEKWRKFRIAAYPLAAWQWPIRQLSRAIGERRSLRKCA
jgi:hypothetical protein